jgi:uncharacterized membrane protein YfcA
VFPALPARPDAVGSTIARTGSPNAGKHRNAKGLSRRDDAAPVLTYLPIAEMAVNPLLIIGLGAVVGVLSGMFGVGGGFLTTPLLILFGVPAPVAVATGANLAAASGVSGLLNQWTRRAVDFRLGLLLVIGGVAGSIIGVRVLAALREAGAAEAVISIAYIVLLGWLGGMMTRDGYVAWRAHERGAPPPVRRRRHGLGQSLPGRMRFPASNLFMNPAPPIVLGVVVGLLSSLMGVGGGFLLIPAMIYLLNVPTNTVVGTSLFHVVLVAAFATFLQAAVNHTVDLVLAGLLILGGVAGAQVGAILGRRLQGDQMRAVLGLIVLAVCLALAGQSALAPADAFTLSAQ